MVKVVFITTYEIMKTISAANQEDAFKVRAHKRLVERLKSQPSSGARNWTRDELYEG